RHFVISAPGAAAAAFRLSPLAQRKTPQGCGAARREGEEGVPPPWRAAAACAGQARAAPRRFWKGLGGGGEERAALRHGGAAVTRRLGLGAVSAQGGGERAGVSVRRRDACERSGLAVVPQARHPPCRMSYMLPHLHNGWQVDQAILSEEDRVVVIRFGHDWDPTCMKMDEVLYSIAEKKWQIKGGDPSSSSCLQAMFGSCSCFKE
uniref:Thioredoxin like 4A n=1 Tax=Dromaius novaehollandiae TaxID=8790 RepID=A0A8C4KP76_DRONO